MQVAVEVVQEVALVALAVQVLGVVVTVVAQTRLLELHLAEVAAEVGVWIISLKNQGLLVVQELLFLSTQIQKQLQLVLV
jgi:hypothetical protein